MAQTEILMARWTRRRMLALSGAMAAAGALSRIPVAVQGATDPTGGYPNLTITIDQQTITVPEQVPAGLTFVTVKNAMPQGGEHMLWGLLPEDVTKADMLQIIKDEDVFQAAAATGTPPAGYEPFMYVLPRMTLVGGPDWAVAGKDSQGIVNFIPGTYVLTNVFGSQSAVFGVVAPGPDAKTEEPSADVTVELGNMVFVGLDQGVPSGMHLWKVSNIDHMAHELAILPVESGTTEQQVLDQLQKAGDDAPFEPVGGTSALSGGKTAWTHFDLKPGSYVALCALPTNWSGPPHAFMGMLKVFEAK